MCGLVIMNAATTVRCPIADEMWNRMVSGGETGIA
jgi:hypothetical protein